MAALTASADEKSNALAPVRRTDRRSMAALTASGDEMSNALVPVGRTDRQIGRASCRERVC